jgi:hypothetical protein
MAFPHPRRQPDARPGLPTFVFLGPGLKLQHHYTSTHSDQNNCQIRTTVQTYSTKKMALDRVRSAQYSVILEYVPRIEPRTTSGKRDRDQALRLRAISARICPSRRDYLPRRWGTASFE